ncbi:hypothetical protein P4S73_07365 [Paraglaciecola sp. Hal342]
MLSGFVEENGNFVVDFDFVIPAYRDCHLGEYVIGKGQQLSKQFGFNEIVALADSYEHENYLSRIGFSPKRMADGLSMAKNKRIFKGNEINCVKWVHNNVYPEQKKIRIN